MKKTILLLIYILLAVSMIFSWADFQVFELTSIVTEEEPVYELELINITRGKAFRIGRTEYRIFRSPSASDVLAEFSIRQTNIARWDSPMVLRISASSGQFIRFAASLGYVKSIGENMVEITILYDGKAKIPFDVVSLTLLSETDSSIKIAYKSL